MAGLTPASGDAAMAAGYMLDCCLSAGAYCDGDTCRAFVHIPFWLAPTQGLHTSVLAGAQYITISGGVRSGVLSGGPAHWERSLVNGTCVGSTCTKSTWENCTCAGPNSQIWNWGADWVAQRADLPDKVCATVWAAETIAGVAGPQTTLDEVCVDIATAALPAPKAQVPMLSYNSFSSRSTSWCEGDDCRLYLHIVYSARAAAAISQLTSGLEVSLDGGATYKSAGTVAYYEQHFMTKPFGGGSEGGVWQVFQADYIGTAEEAKQDRICYKIWVAGAFSSNVTYMDIPNGGCMPVCHQKLLSFHFPDGYCY